MRAFIIRPFGTKTASSGLEIDFNGVEEALIDPALSAVRLEGRTTIEIAEQGNIRQDMFQRLLTSDVVIADITIHNANVFYELGLRHALRDRVTILLRGRSDQERTDDVPFDLKTDRYLAYDVTDPAATRDALIDMLRASMRTEGADSPVLQMLPDMHAQDPVKFLVAPRDFRETVQMREAQGRVADLALMSRELDQFRPDWGRLGQQMIAEALYRMNCNEASAAAWERIVALDPTDYQANRRLGTAYQRLGDLEKSDIALSRIGGAGLTPDMRAESNSLMGSNAKSRWMADWEDLPAEQAPEAALRSPHLEQSRNHYLNAFRQDLNSYYAGLNALAMSAILRELAEVMPDIWNGFHPSDTAAKAAREALDAECAALSAAVRMALDAAAARGDRSPWLAQSRADHALLSSDRPDYVARCFSLALGQADAGNHYAALRQIRIFTRLSLFGEVAKAAEATVAASATKQSRAVRAPNAWPVVFTGHMVDAPGRAVPRFPNTAEAIAAARAMIIEAVDLAQAKAGDAPLVGYAGAACGGDLLFHEVCAEKGIPTWFLLAMDRAEFMSNSVNHGGTDWVDRFNALHREADLNRRVLQLQEDEGLPDWLCEAEGYSVWPRNNLWTLAFSQAHLPGTARVIALWNKGPADGFGGTEDMIDQARQHGIPVDILPAETLLPAEAAE
ncbi:MAG: tetratricopeptide repeat-containing protein [Pseudomonadota bacterium]